MLVVMELVLVVSVNDTIANVMLLQNGYNIISRAIECTEYIKRFPYTYLLCVLELRLLLHTITRRCKCRKFKKVLALMLTQLIQFLLSSMFTLVLTREHVLRYICAYVRGIWNGEGSGFDRWFLRVILNTVRNTRSEIFQYMYSYVRLASPSSWKYYVVLRRSSVMVLTSDTLAFRQSVQGDNSNNNNNNDNNEDDDDDDCDYDYDYDYEKYDVDVDDNDDDEWRSFFLSSSFVGTFHSHPLSILCKIRNTTCKRLTLKREKEGQIYVGSSVDRPNGPTDGWVDGRMDEWLDRWMDGWMDRWMDGWIDGWMDGWMDEWMDGWMGRWMGR
ncbi:hypothetical protein V1478_013180 [Vespula squamosa]|uniref:Uncharacterized protein n=1 Tax=Vespula squamosa TaxID=30214 RepID=A0ABD2AA92_VESSQ